MYFTGAAWNTQWPGEQYILQAPLTPTPGSATQQTGLLAWGGVSGPASYGTAFVTRHVLELHVSPRQAGNALLL